MRPIDIAAAERAAEEEWERELSLTNVEQRREALSRTLRFWDDALTEQLGERVGDYFARIEILEQALDELDAELERQTAKAIN